MRTLRIILGLLVALSTISFGQSKRDIADFKEEFPKTEANKYHHIESYILYNYIGNLSNYSYSKTYRLSEHDTLELSKDTPFIRDRESDMHLTRYNQFGFVKYGRIRFCVSLYEPHYYDDLPSNAQDYYKRVIDRLPESWKDNTDVLPKGMKIIVWHLVFDESVFDEIPEFRTSPKENMDTIPLRVRGLYKKVLKSEQKKVHNVLTKKIKSGYAYGIVEIDGQKIYGWMPIRAVFTAKRYKKD